jgi:hypothetical protein
VSKEAKKPMTANRALNIVMAGHGARCENGMAPCRRCDEEHEAVEVLRQLIANTAAGEDLGLPECLFPECGRVAAHCAEHVADQQHAAWRSGWYSGSGGESLSDNPHKALLTTPAAKDPL